uniref:Mediator of RNA polymerase II transcription subunit 29 n=1 Tax=Romanomermis culicivorax TaxID=13658 RepID=A0A915JJ16_ROMCU
MYPNPQQPVTVAQQQPQQLAVASSVSQMQQPAIAIQQPQQQMTDNNPYLPASRLKFMVPELKQAMSALLKIVAESSKYHLSPLESSSSTNESTSVAETFSKETYRQASEHFWSICDQMEQCFALLIEGERQQAFMNFFLPVTVNTSGVDRSDDSTAGQPSLPNRMTLQYPQFIIAVKKQIDYSRTVCERLNELSNSIAAIRNNACP